MTDRNRFSDPTDYGLPLTRTELRCITGLLAVGILALLTLIGALFFHHI